MEKDLKEMTLAQVVVCHLVAKYMYPKMFVSYFFFNINKKTAKKSHPKEGNDAPRRWWYNDGIIAPRQS